MISRCKLPLLLAGLLVLPCWLLAHDPGLSSARIEIREDRIELFMTLAAADAAAVLDSLIESGRLPRGSTLSDRPDTVASAIGWLFLGGKPMPETSVDFLPPSEPGELHVQVVFAAPRSGALVYRAKCFDHLARGHRQLAFANRSKESLAEAILDTRNATLAFGIE